jgi:inorganic pyrophosphatase
MPISQFLKDAREFDLQVYKKPADIKELPGTHIPFTGSPLRHPFDKKKLILVADPYSNNTFYYEFRTVDVSYVEELPNIVNMDGIAMVMARLWVKKQSIGMRCTPFVIEDLRFSPHGL